jgi:hypothetical protein
MMILGPMEKVDGSEFFGVDFDQICQKSDLYGFMEKQPPQKALCLGPDPPLRNTINFIDFMVFFGFWAFNTAGKTVTKVGIYALPPLGGPQKVTFFENYRFLLIF